MIYINDNIKNNIKNILSMNSTTSIAKKLLGHLITFNGLSGYIVETEAYLGVEDEACHSYKGHHSDKNNSMYLSAGTIYVYSIFGQNLLNIITQDPNVPQGVLIRAIQPIEINQSMLENRNQHGYNISNGPGKLTQALGIDKTINGTMINCNHLYLDSYEFNIPNNIISTNRIGIKNKGI
ncbi:DNA-3-methyladenine glycosylase [Apilactobacillus apisilvae]|uniref:Putative 3-methyladenine DNA glycosylase n=1 Tax=Apilactobacillus apisilvae TaxID=2923364 RepID=A0ABY4PJ24_9LACO|nr:DNA-3-methyladenine glycosylase [Apilactobacillus apisilvae]UQS85461.1 DNA-3-methyladenine glycosylase [Apilactobacillus apisilvae]